MTVSVLVVDDDESFRSAIARDLARHDFEVHVANGVTDAGAIIAARRIDVLLTDLRMPDSDGIDMMTLCRTLSSHTRPVLMSGFASARDYKTAMELGAVTVLCKPFTPSELLGAIQRAAECTKGFHGTLHGMSLIDVVQLLHLGRRSVSVLLHGPTTGRIDFDDGEVVHAALGEQSGAEAFATLLSQSGGAISTTALPEQRTRSIAESFDMLLLDSLRLNDEGERPPEEVAPPQSVPRRTSLPPPPPSPEAHARVAWMLASRLMGAGASPAALAISLEKDEAIALTEVLDAAELARACRPLIAAARALVGSGNLTLDATGGGVGLGFAADTDNDYAVVLLDQVATAVAVPRFRSAVATVARCMLSTTRGQFNGGSHGENR